MMLLRRSPDEKATLSVRQMPPRIIGTFGYHLKRHDSSPYLAMAKLPWKITVTSNEELLRPIINVPPVIRTNDSSRLQPTRPTCNIPEGRLSCATSSSDQ
mmetsp:Transcript_17960/g.37242  ORF Transcript_17960/g.37242 Transcript_17960/m.37242 type:complete len:100 (-) Transcript_17960:182-481(-)